MKTDPRPQLRRLVFDFMDVHVLRSIRCWLKDADGKIIEEDLGKDEITMIDGLFEWGCEEIEREFADFGFFDPTLICFSPHHHAFKSNILLTNRYRECQHCGYSPELDGARDEWQTVHKDFIIYQRDK